MRETQIRGETQRGQGDRYETEMDRSRDIKEAERQKGRHIHRQMLESQRGAERGTERETETQRQ